MTKVEKIIDLINEEIAEIKSEMQAVELKPWQGIANIKYNFVIFTNAVFKIIVIVNEAVQALEDPEIKQDDIFDAVTKILNDLIDVPWVPEFVEGKAIHMVLVKCDNIIDKYLGDDWLDVIGDSVKKANLVTSNIEDFIKKINA